jgi:hypothetical protein
LFTFDEISDSYNSSNDIIIASSMDNVWLRAGYYRISYKSRIKASLSTPGLYMNLYDLTFSANYPYTRTQAEYALTFSANYPYT